MTIHEEIRKGRPGSCGVQYRRKENVCWLVGFLTSPDLFKLVTCAPLTTPDLLVSSAPFLDGSRDVISRHTHTLSLSLSLSVYDSSELYYYYFLSTLCPRCIYTALLCYTC